MVSPKTRRKLPPSVRTAIRQQKAKQVRLEQAGVQVGTFRGGSRTIEQVLAERKAIPEGVAADIGAERKRIAEAAKPFSKRELIEKTPTQRVLPQRVTERTRISKFERLAERPFGEAQRRDISQLKPPTPSQIDPSIAAEVRARQQLRPVRQTTPRVEEVKISNELAGRVPSGVLEPDRGLTGGVITPTSAIKEEIKATPSFIGKAEKALLGVGVLGTELEERRSKLAPLVIAAGSVVGIPAQIVSTTIRKGPAAGIESVVFGTAEAIIRPQQALRATTPLGRIAEIGGIFIAGESFARPLPRIVKARKEAVFRRITEIPEARKTGFILTGDSIPSTSRLIELGKKVPKEKQIAFKKGLIEPVKKTKTQIIARKPKDIIQGKISQKTQKALPEPTFKLITESGQVVSRVRPETQLRFRFPEREVPTIQERLKVVKQIPKAEPRRLALQRFLESKKGQILTGPETILRPTREVISGVGEFIRKVKLPSGRVPLLIKPESSLSIVETSSLERIALAREKAISKEITEPKIKERIGQIPIIESISIIGVSSIARQEAKQSVQQDILPEQILVSKSVSISKAKVTAKTKIKTPLRFIPPITDERKKKQTKQTEDKLNQGFNTFIKEKGKFFKANKRPLPENKAHNLGADLADNSSAATFKVTKANKKTKLKDDSTKQISKFTRKNNLFIEKNKHRIDSRGELQGITAKGLIAIRKKAASRRIKFI